MVLPKMDINNRVAMITFNNPPANALSSKIVAEIDQLLNKIESDSNIRAVVYIVKVDFSLQEQTLKNLPS